MEFNFSTSKFETYMYSLLNNKVAERTYAGGLPDSIVDGTKTMINIDCSLPIIDADAMANGTFYVELYAKPKSDGTKNVALMAEMENKLIDIIKNQMDGHYVIDSFGSRGDYDTQINWHVNIYEIIVKMFN